ncbi:MAG TPA: Mur ligase domain-containing protein, partial [Vicinamibacterales bacterium]|nr:Mur ligase domain-containing protein [Vicinamibacterales bacterium]
MTWTELQHELRERGLVRAETGASTARVIGVAYDSRTVARGDVFVALKGQHADGTAFTRQALDRGAVAIVSEQERPAEIGAPWTVVQNARVALAYLSLAFYGDPSHEMKTIGVTGTNGKTTTAYLLASI